MPLSPQYENYLLPSFLLYLDHIILNKGGYYATSGQFYKMPETYGNNLYTYSNQFGPIVSDFSITGNIPTGCFINGNYSLKGQNGLVDIDYSKGVVILSGVSNAMVTTNYCFKQFPIVTPDYSDLSILFKTKHTLRPKINQTATGFFNNEANFPIIYANQVGGDNLPFCFGGIDETITNIGLYLFIDNKFNLDGLCNILKDLRHEYVPLLDNFPYNSLGGMKNNINYNYNTITNGRVAAGSGALIKDVIITDFSRRGLDAEIQSLPDNAHFRVVEFELGIPRLT